MRIFLIAIITAFTFLSSCKEDIIKVKFKTNHSFDIVIPASQGTVNVPFNVPTPPVQVGTNGSFEANDTRVDKVEEAYLNFMKLTITDPPDETFSFITDIYMYISADGLDEVLFASKENIVDTTGSLDLDVNNINFAPYVKAGSFDIRTSVVVDELLTSDVTVKTDFQFSITAVPLN